MRSTMATIHDRIRESGIRMTWKPTDRNRWMDSDGSRMDHYRITLRVGKARMTFTYSKGVGHNGAPPTLPEVLSCIAQDAAGFDNAGSYGGWVAEYGSEGGEALYRAVGRQRDGLYRLCAAVGPCFYQNLVWHTDPE